MEQDQTVNLTPNAPKYVDLTSFSMVLLKEARTGVTLGLLKK
jgi:hypothetical protein